VDMVEKRANWLTMRSSSDGGSKKTGSGAAAEHFHGEHLGAFFLEDAQQQVGDHLVDGDEVHAPDDAVAVVLLQVLGDEVQGDGRRIGPVEQTRRQAVVLAQGHPVPDGIVEVGLLMGVLAEVAQQVAFELRERTAQPHEGGLQVAGGLGQAAEAEVRPEPSQFLLEGILEESVVQFVPGRDTDVVHGQGSPHRSRDGLMAGENR
jgi:hypothetical protein